MLVASGPFRARSLLEPPVRSVAPVALVGLSAPLGVPDRQRLLPAVPAGDGSRQAGSGAEAPSRPPGGSNRIVAFRQLGFCFGIAPVADASLPCRSVHPRTLPEQGFWSSLSGRGDPANGSAPLAASAVRQAPREKEPGMFSDAAAGIAAVSSG